MTQSTPEEVVKLVNLCEGRKEQVEKLLAKLEKSGFFSAPASASHHLNIGGGLIQHSLNVTKLLLTIRDKMYDSPNDYGWLNAEESATAQIISRESCVIAGLFHDVHKCTDGFGREYYGPNTLKSGKISEAKPYEINKEITALCGGYTSALMVSKYIALYENELQAICCHDGQYVPENREVRQKEHPLTLMLHFADMFCASQQENDKSWFYRPVNQPEY